MVPRLHRPVPAGAPAQPQHRGGMVERQRRRPRLCRRRRRRRRGCNVFKQTRAVCKAVRVVGKTAHAVGKPTSAAVAVHLPLTRRRRRAPWVPRPPPPRRLFPSLRRAPPIHRREPNERGGAESPAGAPPPWGPPTRKVERTSQVFCLGIPGRLGYRAKPTSMEQFTWDSVQRRPGPCGSTRTVRLKPRAWTIACTEACRNPAIVDSDPSRACALYKTFVERCSWAIKTSPRSLFYTFRTAVGVSMSA